MRAARTLLAVAGLALATRAADGQTIETVAGGGPGNGSPALAVNLRTPQDVVRDAVGNTYVAVSDDRRVYKIKTDGTIELVAGIGSSGTSGDGGPAVKAELVSPRGLGFDTDGSLLIADEGGRRVRRVDLVAGTISTLIGGGTFTGEGILALQIILDAPRDIVVQSGGDVFLADGHRVRRLDRATGLVSTVAGTGTAGFSDGTPASTKRLNEPRALALDPAGNILIADGGNGRIRKLDLATDTLSSPVSGVCSPGGVATDAAGAIYLSSNTGSCGSNSQKLLKSVSGSLSSIAATGSSYVAQLSVLAGGTLLVADRDNFRLKSVTAGGTTTVIAGNGTIGYYGDGIPALSASMLSPTQVRADAAGNIFVYDNTNRIRRITPAGIDVTLASTANCGSDPNAVLCSVEGIAILPGGALAFSESKDDKLHKIDIATGAVTDLTPGALGRPRGIAAMASGIVYVADRGVGNNNGTIRKVDSTTGVVTTVASGLARPQYVAVDASENVYFTSLNGSSILRIPAGGGAPANYATLTSAVTGLDADAAGNVYAADSNNQVWRIAVVTAVKTLRAGSGVTGLGDGGPSIAASLSGPGGVACVGDDLYIADALNYRIRRVRSNLGPSAVAGPDQVVEATSVSGATVALDGAASSDPDGNPLSFTWTGPFGTVSGATASVALPLGTHSITLSVSDGQASASDTVSVTVQDTIGPVISFVRSPLPNAYGWNNTAVTISFTCTDSGSGLAVPSPAPEIVASEGEGQQRSFQCSDTAGNTASLTVSDINIDMKAPTMTSSAAPAPNAAGWNNTDVTVSFACTDDLSGVASCEPALLLSNEAASQSASGSCLDKAGNAASATSSGINIDKTAPSLDFAAASPAPNANGWNNTDVAFAFTASDTLSGVGETSAPSPIVVGDEGAAVSKSVSVSDLAGNSASFSTPAVRIDKTAPEVTGSRSPLANGSGWNNTDVTVSVSATDLLSGVASCEPDVVVATEGASQSFTRSCTDLAGNSASATVAEINVDKTAPSSSAVASPAANAHGWNNTDVTVTFEATDTLSGVASCDPSVVLSAEGAGQSATGACIDVAGNSASSSATGINIDKTAPVVTGAPARPADKNGWFNHAVSISFSGTDALSGVLSCASSTYAGPDTLSASVSGACSDRAGNEGTGSFELKFDATAPTVSITTPPNGANYTLNQSVAAQYSCNDNLSGVDTCAGPVSSGAPISTSPVGSKTFQVTAMDAAGNSGVAKNTYGIQYKFVGFLQPVDNLPVVNLANAGRTIPIKWQLKDASGAHLSDLGSVVSMLSAPLACDAAPTDIIEEEAAATGGTQLRYDAAASQFIFNWNTQKSWANTCVQIQLTLADGTKQYAKFRLK